LSFYKVKLKGLKTILNIGHVGGQLKSTDYKRSEKIYSLLSQESATKISVIFRIGGCYFSGVFERTNRQLYLYEFVLASFDFGPYIQATICNKHCPEEVKNG
jgi:hypothetical protein